MRNLLSAALLILLGGLVPTTAAAEAPSPLPGPFDRILIVPVEGEVDGLLQAYVTERIRRAVEGKYPCVVFRVDSYGGGLQVAKDIGDAVFDMPPEIHTVAWVPSKAISAAAFISLACDEVVVAPQATFGDCQPILMGLEGGVTPAGEKIESPLRAWFRAYATENGYPVLLAEAMVSKDLGVVRIQDTRPGGTQHFVAEEAFQESEEGAILVPEAGLRRRDAVQVGAPVSVAGQLLTVTGREALDLGFIRRAFPGGLLPEDDEALLEVLATPEARIVREELTASERAMRFLHGLSGVLAAIVALAVMVTLWKSPGWFTLVGVVALTLLLLISATAQHLHGLPIFLFAVGVLLLAAEVFVLPGFTVAGALGIVTLSGACLMLATGLGLGDSVGQATREAAMRFGLQFLAAAIAGLLVLGLLVRFGGVKGPGRRMILPAPAPPVRPSPALKAGQVGVARSPLRPAGWASFGGQEVSVLTQGEYLEAGTPVRIVRVEGSAIVVEQTAPEGSRSLAC